MNIDKSIEVLNTIVYTKINEVEVHDESENILTSLREYWLKHKNQFSKAHIDKLKLLSGKVDAIGKFIEIQEEFEYIQTKEDVDEIIGQLYQIVTETSELSLNARVNKEIRELIEKQVSLPSKITIENDMKISRAITSLESKGPSCDKCGNKMVVRKGDTYFWGCSIFPKCWGTKSLSPSEDDLLYQ